jgi:hypothetical protein
MDGQRLNSRKALEYKIPEEWMTGVIEFFFYKGKEKRLHRGIRLCREISLLNVACNVYAEFVTRNVNVIN